jgi:phytoene dehydrogenase-like protein
VPYDVIVVGAGLGGLLAAAKLVGAGRKVLVLEKNPHIGGTSYVFRRGLWSFPMGPLSFSFPDRVRSSLEEAGVDTDFEFRRNHFQLITPGLNVVYSQPLADLSDELARTFPKDAAGLKIFFLELADIIRTAGDIDRWHPAFRAGPAADPARPGLSDPAERLERVRRWASVSSASLLSRLISDPLLRNLLGSQGTTPPLMSLLNLGVMWHAMSEAGIWFPSCGIHGLCRRLAAAVGFGGGEVRTSAGVREILVRHGQATGVVTERGEEIAADWIVSNADYKKTFLELLPADAAPAGHLDIIRRVPYTGSELCVYLGVDPRAIDLGAMRATHLFFRKSVRDRDAADPDDFEDKEIEICRWSDNAPEAVPEGSASLILRVSHPYGAWTHWRTGERTRLEGYRETKNRLAWSLIRTVESLLPGLSTSVKIMEAATPLTYRDRGQRTNGSIAGWSWSADAARLPDRILVRTPVRNLLAAGIYAATGLFIGGVPTALFTGGLAADLILEAT